MKKVLSILFDFLIVLVIVFAVIVTFMSLSTNDNGITSIGGFMPLNIQTASMEPTINAGDMIITEETDFDELKVNDIISYLSKEQDETIIITHRIVDIKEGQITTKGDNNSANDDTLVNESNFVGKYNGVRIPILGTILTFLQSQVGFFIFIIIPLFILFIYQLYKFISTIMDEKKKELIEQIKKEQAKE